LYWYYSIKSNHGKKTWNNSFAGSIADFRKLTGTKNTFIRSRNCFYLGMEGTSGKNGMAVAYNPENQYYYAIIGGNSSFPVEVFDKNGDHLYETNTGFDSRGLWYNIKEKRLEGKSYGNEIYYYTLNSEGFPVRVDKAKVSSLKDAGEQNVAIYDEKSNQIIVFNNGKLYFYSAKNGKLKKSIPIRRTDDEYNYVDRSFVWTGVKGMEAAFFNLDSYKLEFYDIKTGQKSGEIYIPLDFYPESQFNISYANNYFFVYDVEYKEWGCWKIWRE
jgi:hypothetical protein